MNRISGGFSPNNNNTDQNMLVYPRKSSANDSNSQNRYSSWNEIETPKSNKNSIGGRGSGGMMITPEMKPRKLTKERRNQLTKANSLLVTLNEIQEEEEDDKIVNAPSDQLKTKSYVIYEDSREQLSGQTPSDDQTGNFAKQVQKNKTRHENMSMERQKKAQDEKRNVFKQKGRIKSEILPEKMFSGVNRHTNNRGNYVDASPYSQGNMGQSGNDNLNPFSQLKRDILYSNTSMQDGDNHRKMYRSMANFDEELDSVQQEDFKVQELNRRNRLNSANSGSVSSVYENEENALLDQGYYELLEKLNQQDESYRLKNMREFDQYSLLQHKVDNKNVKEWVKMVKNLRFKINYNHYEENLKWSFYNKKSTLLELADPLMQKFLNQIVNGDFMKSPPVRPQVSLKPSKSTEKLKITQIQPAFFQNPKLIYELHDSDEELDKLQEDSERFVSKRFTM